MHSFILNNFPKEELLQRIREIAGLDTSTNFENHPDILTISPDPELKNQSIKIEQIRKIKTHLIHNPFSISSHVVIIEKAESLTHAAQNALLKLLEEPSVSSLFFLSTENYKILLPTIISRCQIISFKLTKIKSPNKDLADENQKISAMSLTQRLIYVEKYHKDKELALSWIETQINSLRNNLNTQNTNLIKILIKTHEDIKNNINLKLSLDILALEWTQNKDVKP